MVKFVIVASDPAATARFWGGVLGEFRPPCRLHPGLWVGTHLATSLIITGAETTPPGVYLNSDVDYAEHKDWEALGGTAFRDEAGRLVAIADPEGNRLPLLHLPSIPVRLGHPHQEEAHRAIREIAATIRSAMSATGLSNARLISPDDLARQGDTRGPFRLIIDGDGDRAHLDQALAGAGGRHYRITSMRAADVPERIRGDVERLAHPLDELAPEDQAG